MGPSPTVPPTPPRQYAFLQSGSKMTDDELEHLKRSIRDSAGAMKITELPPEFSTRPSVFEGMNKRELFSLVAMNALISTGVLSIPEAIDDAVKAADLLITRTAKHE